MKKLTILVSIFFLSFISVTTYCQEKSISTIESDHLLPLRPQFGVHKNYNLKIQNILFDGISDFQFTQFLSKPSFGYESVLVIEIDTANLKDPDFNIVYHICKSSIWHSLSDRETKNIEVDKFRKSISMSDAKKIENLYSAALSQVCESNRFGIDGVSYDFATMAQAGRAWLSAASKDETKVGQLIEINRALIELVKKDKKKFLLNGDLSLKIETLTAEFEGTRR